MTNPLTIQGQKIFLEALAGRKGISVNWDRTCEVPTATKQGSITLPPPTIENATIWAYWSHHEVSHVFPENMWTYDVLDHIKDDFENAIANILVDYIADTSIWGEYEGRDKIMDRGRAAKIQAQYAVDTTGNSAGEPYALILDLIRVDHEARCLYKGTPALNLVHFTANEGEYAQKLRNMSLGDKLEACRTTTQLLQLIKDIKSLLEADESEGEEGDDEGEGEEGEGEGEGGEGEGSEGEEGESTDESEGKPDDSGENADGSEGSADESDSGEAGESGESGESSSDGSEGEDAEGEEGKGDSDDDGGEASSKKAKVDYKPVTEKQESTPYQVGDKLPDGISPEMGEDIPVPEDVWDYKGPYAPMEDEHIIDLSKGRRGNGSYFLKDIRRAQAGSTLTKQVRKYLMTMSTTRWEGGKKMGTIQPKAMSRVYTSTSHRPSIYKTRTSSQIRSDVAVTLLVDFSGSMRGSCYITAAASAVAMSEILTGLRIPHEVLGFTEDRGRLHYILKPFAGSVKLDELMIRFSDNRIDMGCNDDGASLHWAAGRLMDRKETNKTLIVFSDGQPASNGLGDARGYLKKVTKLIEEESPINLVGIGIESQAVQSYYTNWKTVRQMKDLERALLDTLQQAILK